MKVTCLECGHVCDIRRAERNRGNGKFCSRSCSVSHQNRTTRNTGKTMYTYREKKARYGRSFMLGQIASRIKERSRKYGIKCAVTVGLVREMWNKQNGRCWYTNRPMTVGVSTRKKIDLDQVSVDRINPNRGYVKGNIVLCCFWVNTAKGSWTLRDLLIRVVELVKRAS